MYKKNNKAQPKGRKAQSTEHRNLTPGPQRTQRPAQNNYLQPSSSQNSFSTQRSGKILAGLDNSSEYHPPKGIPNYEDQERIKKSYQSEHLSYAAMPKTGVSRDDKPVNLSYDHGSRFFSPISNRGSTAAKYLRGEPQSAEMSKNFNSRIAAMSKYIPGIHQTNSESQPRKIKTSSYERQSGNYGHNTATAKLIQKVEAGIYESKGQISPLCKNNGPTTDTNSSTMPLSLQPYAQNSLAALQKSSSPLARRIPGQMPEPSKDSTTMLTNKLSLDVVNGNSTALAGLTGSQLNHALTTGHINTTIAFLSAADT